MQKFFLSSLFLFAVLVPGFSQTDSDSSGQLNASDIEALLRYQVYIDSIVNSLKYETGTVTLGDNLATITVPAGFKYLNGDDAVTVLTELWGNPPGNKSLGMLFPENDTPMSDSSFAINITWSEDGYIDDSDAKDIDYNELLTTMQNDTKEENKQRQEAGYPTIDLVGWASSPYYDAQSKKLHWAMELKFAESDENTLNYNIRVLGRKGYLNMNVIGGMYVLDEVKAKINSILPSVSFTDGNKYSDFNPDIDQVAAYGIGGLIAGKVLAKVGILAKLGVFFAKFWKLIAIGAVALIAGIRKLFGRKEAEENAPPAEEETA